MLPYFKNIIVPVMFFPVDNYNLIYPSNAAFASRKFVNAACLDIQMIPNRGHLISFSEMNRIKQAILEMMQLSNQYFVARSSGGFNETSAAH